jgi:hypothetical protein
LVTYHKNLFHAAAKKCHPFLSGNHPMHQDHLCLALDNILNLHIAMLFFFIFDIVQIVPCQMILLGGSDNCFDYFEFSLHTLKLRKEIQI